MSKAVLLIVGTALISGCVNGTGSATSTTMINTSVAGEVKVLYSDKTTGLVVYYRPLGEERIRISVEGAPAYVHALEMAPQKLEAKLASDKWLVLSFAIWSVPDIQSIRDAVKTVKRHEGRIHLGLRPYSNVRELPALDPSFADGGESPIWVMIENGKTIRAMAGKKSVEELESFLNVSVDN